MNELSLARIAIGIMVVALLAAAPARAERTLIFVPDFQQPFTELICQPGAVPECDMAASAARNGTVASSTHLPGPVLLGGSYVSSGMRLSLTTTEPVESLQVSVDLHIDEAVVAHDGLLSARAAVDVLVQVVGVPCCDFIGLSDLLATSSVQRSLGHEDRAVVVLLVSDDPSGQLPPGDYEVDVLLRAYAIQGGLASLGESRAHVTAQMRSIVMTLMP